MDQGAVRSHRRGSTPAGRDPFTHIVQPGGDVLIARIPNGTAAGCVALLRYSSDLLELATMGVRAEFRSRGAGQRLREAAIARARPLDARRLFLGTNSRPAAALRLYEDSGFRRISREELPLADYYARADILMQLSLDEPTRPASTGSRRPPWSASAKRPRLRHEPGYGPS
ncbi:GNAT family N-acetyltransferase [Streptomyces tauricus]|uniref:GNAT family N-acetyltransferase n=1 Tax=Streptomyces tauricus TaxID=68274 RepID=UPI0039081D4D